MQDYIIDLKEETSRSELVKISNFLNSEFKNTPFTYIIRDVMEKLESPPTVGNITVAKVGGGVLVIWKSYPVATMAALTGLTEKTASKKKPSIIAGKLLLFMRQVTYSYYWERARKVWLHLHITGRVYRTPFALL